MHAFYPSMGDHTARRGETEVTMQLVVITNITKLCVRSWPYKCLAWAFGAVLEYDAFIPESMFVLGALALIKACGSTKDCHGIVINRNMNAVCQ